MREFRRMVLASLTSYAIIGITAGSVLFLFNSLSRERASNVEMHGISRKDRAETHRKLDRDHAEVVERLKAIEKREIDLAAERLTHKD